MCQVHSLHAATAVSWQGQSQDRKTTIGVPLMVSASCAGGVVSFSASTIMEIVRATLLVSDCLTSAEPQRTGVGCRLRELGESEAGSCQLHSTTRHLEFIALLVLCVCSASYDATALVLSVNAGSRTAFAAWYRRKLCAVLPL